MNRSSFRCAATAVLLLLPAFTRAQTHDHACLDDGCTRVALFDTAGEGGIGAAADAAPRFGAWGIDLTGMDTSAKPGADFFRYVNGAWADRTTIPPDRTTFGASAVLRDLAEGQVRALLDEWAASTSLAAGSDEARLARLYRSFMDEAGAEQRDAKPLASKLAAIRGATTRDVSPIKLASAAVFAPGVSDDMRNPEQYTLYLSQSGLGLQDREFYLRDNFAPQKKAYRDYVARMLGLAGWASPDTAADAVVGFETRIAEAHWTRAESRNRDKTYNPTTWSALTTSAPGFAWQAFAKAAGIDGASKVVVRQDTAIPKIAAIVGETPVDTLQAWQAFRTIDQAAPYLSSRFVTAHWEFRSKFLQGAQEPRARWKRGVAFAEAGMGEAIGRTYVARHFPPDSKAKMERLVAGLREAMRLRIEALTWMAPATKAAALEKLANFGVKIGYPAKWRDYHALEVTDEVFANWERVAAFEWARDVARIGKPVDEDEWGMTPQTVNAYYSPAKNEIAFPAAILQPPYFDPQADMAVNDGAIGGVIAHELTHGFDDQGRKSDGKGVLRDWWTPEDAKRFEAQADRLGAQYEAYVFPTLPGMKLTARTVMGENIADLGGVLLGLDAYKLSLNGAPSPVLDGFTGTQRVFLGWAQAWRIKSRDDALRQQIVNDSHSPGFIRAFAPLRNVDAWYDSFDVKPGDALYIAPDQRVRIW